jgi:hypothetical protein
VVARCNRDGRLVAAGKGGTGLAVDEDLVAAEAVSPRFVRATNDDLSHTTTLRAKGVRVGCPSARVPEDVERGTMMPMVASASPVVQAVVLFFGASMLGFSGLLLLRARRASHPNEDWVTVYGHMGLRTGAGIAAICAGLGGGVVAGGCLVALLIADILFIEVTRRLRRRA